MENSISNIIQSKIKCTDISYIYPEKSKNKNLDLTSTQLRVKKVLLSD